MSQVHFSGFETGDLSEWPTISGTVTAVSSPLISGVYGAKLLQGSFIKMPVIFNLPTAGVRVRFQIHITTNPGADQLSELMATTDSVGNALAAIRMVISTTGVITLQGHQYAGTDINVGSAITISPDTTYLAEFKSFISATVGTFEWKFNGVSQANFSGNTGTANIASLYLQAAFGSGTGYGIFDDFCMDDANFPGPGRSIKVQGATGTPNVDAFTKTGAATAALCWSTTPFATAANCNSSTSGAGQTMLVADSGLTIQQINGCKVGMIAKTAVASAHSIRRRLNSVNTDTSKSLTTADAYYDSGVFTDTIANLRSAEIGVLHGANSNLLTVEDMWLMIDYTDASLVVKPTLQAVTQAANW